MEYNEKKKINPSIVNNFINPFINIFHQSQLNIFVVTRPKIRV